MYRGKTVGVILPAYNEAEHVGSVIESLPAFVDQVYAIDDCSTDETWEIICEYATGTTGIRSQQPADVVSDDRQVVLPDGHGRPLPAVIPIQHDVNQGAGGTLKTGYRLAERDGMDATVTIDADGQMDPEQMDRLLDPIVEGRAEFAKGNRLADADVAGGMPGFRLLGNWLLTLLMKPASGYWRLRDPQNGYTAIAHEALSTIDVDALPADHDYPNDLITRLNAAEFRIADVPMAAIYADEESTIEFREFVRRTSKTMLESFLWRLRRATARGRPQLPVLYTAGLLGLAVGGLLAASSTVQRLGETPNTLAGGAPESTLTLIGGVVALLAAVGLDEYSDAEVIRE